MRGGCCTKPRGVSLFVCRRQRRGLSGGRISRAMPSIARRWAYTASVKSAIVSWSSGRGFVQQPPRGGALAL
jgi:hypothetical protein